MENRHRSFTQIWVIAAMPLELKVALPANGIRVDDGAAIELPSGQANVRLYLVQSMATPTHAPAMLPTPISSQ